MVALPDIVNFLGAISSIAIIAGAGFVVIQLRQNANLLKASLRQDKREAAFSMLERLTDESFPKRRTNFYRVIEKYKKENWEGFDDSGDDFEARNFAYIYELYGQMVREGIIEFRHVADMLQYLAVFDWKEFEPLSEHYSERWGAGRVAWWRNFAWLAEESEKYMLKREKTAGPKES